jgi:16S rRNA (cytosine1402-N4)-methyltransferase
MTPRGSAEERHVPVLRDRILELLAPALQEPGSVFLDGTLGMGGHTEAVLAACPAARAVGIDRDTQALDLAGERLASYGDRFTGIHAVYDELPRVLADLGLGTVDAVLFDLGVSSLQLDEAERGFAYRHDAPLDMRMDQSGGITAAEVLNTYDAPELERILRDYGEERFARRVAAAIVRERQREPFATSARLVEVLKKAIPAASQKSGGHPGKRTFQALRIEVNAELEAWETALPAAVDALAVGGRIAVLSYHSL